MKKLIIPILLLSLLLCSGAWGALIADDDPNYTHSFVDTDVVGGAGNGTSWPNAYATFALAEAENRNCVTATKSHVIHCRGTSADTGIGTTIDGWTTNALYHLIVQGDSTTGVWDNSKYHHSITTTASWDRISKLDDDYIELRNLQFSVDNTALNYTLVCFFYISQAQHISIHHCIFDGIDKTKNNQGIWVLTSASTNLIYNNVFYNMLYALYLTAGTNYIVCNTMVDNGNDVYNLTGSNPVTYVYNNILAAAGIGGGGGAVAPAGASYNAISTDKGGTAYPSGYYAVYNLPTTVFNNYAADDFTLAPTAVQLIDQGDGTNCSSIVTDDIEMESRPATASLWDIGADELPMVTFATPNPSDGGTGSKNYSLGITIDDSNSNANDLTFYGRVKPSDEDDFRFIIVPDTQWYAYVDDVNFTVSGCADSATKGTWAQYLRTAMNWIVANQASLNIKYVGSLGDLTQSDLIEGDPGGGSENRDEWCWVDTQWSKLDTIPSLAWSVLPGNHDRDVLNGEDTDDFNATFPYTRFTQPWYGGHRSTTNDANYVFVSGGGLDFIIISLPWAPSADDLTWASALLQANLTKIGIVVTHAIIENDATWSTVPGDGVDGEALYDALKASVGVTNTNLKFILAGHNTGEAYTTATYDGVTTHIIMSDYQEFGATKGDGYFRIMTFKPSENSVQIQTYSPVLDTYMTDNESAFEIAMPEFGAFSAVQTANAGVADGGTSRKSWLGLTYNSQYEWYVSADNTHRTNVSDSYSFTIGSVVSDPLVIEQDSIILSYAAINGGGTGVGVTVNAGLTGVELYNVTTYDCTKGFDIDSDVTMKNCLGWSLTGDDIDIAGGITVTGDYNWFQDAAKAGDGTYTDGGDTTFSASDPLFKSASDFHLTAQSPLAVRYGGDTSVWPNGGTDFSGRKFYPGQKIAMGAYQWQGSPVAVMELLLEQASPTVGILQPFFDSNSQN